MSHQSFLEVFSAYRGVLIQDIESFFRKEENIWNSSKHPHIEQHFNLLRSMCAGEGKMLRPILSSLFYEGFSGKHFSEVSEAIIAFELFHNYTLIHDDIYDEDAYRRGKPVIHTIFQNSFPLNEGNRVETDEVLYQDVQKRYGVVSGFISGKILHNLGIRAMLQAPIADPIKLEGIQLYTHTGIYDNLGQAMDLDAENKVEISRLEYEELAYYKTGKLLQASALWGAILAGVSDENIRKTLQKYGKSIALAFQIRDDLLDIGHDGGEKGRDKGSDIKKAKKTLLCIFAFQAGTTSQKEELSGIFGNVYATDLQIERAIEILYETGAVDKTVQEGLQALLSAQNALSELAPHLKQEILTVLLEFTKYVWHRKK